MAYWSVAQCEPQREPTAHQFLTQQGFDVYLPIIKGERRRFVPLFPSYLFVRIIDQWWAVTRTIGVLRVLMNGEQPAFVADDVVSKIQKQEKNGVIRLPAQRPKFLRGDEIRVVDGTFFGKIGVYEGMAPHDRQRVLLELLGRKVPVELPQTAIERAQAVA
jgi:transcription antitermination factor NusG